ncbi:beta-1,3-galactosyltransferase 5-like [Gastrophryne carolinensis]
MSAEKIALCFTPRTLNFFFAELTEARTVVLSMMFFVHNMKRPLSAPPEDRRAVDLPPRRRSVTLRDDAASYHLNLSRFLAEFPHLQNYRCSLLLAPSPDEDDPLGPSMLLAVKSHPQSAARRVALRQTWAKQWLIEGYKVRAVFLMARSNHTGAMEMVGRESQEYGDVLLWDFMEGHHNLSLKERCFLEWLHLHLPHVDFIFKGDDDEFVNPTALVRYVKEHGTPYTLHGALQNHSIVLRHSKYQVSKTLFPNPKYPCFLSGGGFVFPGHAVKLLYWASRRLPVFPLDDVYFGFLALAANVTLRNERRFFVWGLKFDTCSFQNALVVHGISPPNLVDVWTKVQEARCHGVSFPAPPPGSGLLNVASQFLTWASGILDIAFPFLAWPSELPNLASHLLALASALLHPASQHHALDSGLLIVASQFLITVSGLLDLSP